MSDAQNSASVLVVEDEFLIALDIQVALQGLGCAVDMAADLTRALSLAGSRPLRAAILDINLGGKRSFEVASLLKDRAIPFAFLTGYDGEIVPEEFADAPVLKKPFTRADLAETLARLKPPPL